MKSKKAIIVLSLALVLSACVPVEEKHFNVKYLFGEWTENTDHYKYREDGTGSFWDTSDDVAEEEATPFEWSLSFDTLLVNHLLWNGSIVPKIYIVTVLDSIQLDNYDLVSGEAHHYTKVTVP